MSALAVRGEPGTLTSSQKAAVVLVQLGREHAARVLSRMGPVEVEELAAEIAQLGALDPQVADDVITEFREMAQTGGFQVTRGGVAVARSFLEATLGSTRADDVMERVAIATPGKVFEFLLEMDPRQILSFLTGEHPQTTALVLAHLQPVQAATVLAGLPGEIQTEVAHRIAVMDRPDPDLVQLVAEDLSRRSSTIIPAAASTAPVGGLQPLVDVLARADPATEKLVLEGLDTVDAELAEQVRQRMFVFDDITGLEDKAVQLLARQVETAVLALALKGTADATRDKVLSNVSERARENLLEEIDLLGAVRLSDVEEARGSVVAVIRGLEASGEIVLRREGADEYVS
ncbi:flagellar motor switch protein FliG [Pseudokineococcus marinus]|uniref:flagellar motor switch protein FliG n=1 Tax=Pseudokineococcus marinus TaxID=351215 RepID=UPI002634B95D|nr:flagellar motor switch protein FliG [Pseudokineococcus marinus]